ncbi:outer membrane beta-barrel protein [Chryseolinea lacunae]|uniref:Outer membrane beta-barrel protein n=1 Tax=Chryseolinea lacunae TaxID=2801331 RepID=A0ABS1KLL5_9BACT|nr:outer membrane beta-barrel protein [Chryseolinea lacunae]MBL0740128.1 outer membrane beta-barrel protein [Chryseolinea lacunae]
MKKLAILFLLTGVCTFVNAQENYFYLNWDINQPLTNTDWLGATSARGVKVGYRVFIGSERKFSAGLDVNWTTFAEYKPTETFEQTSGAITTDYFNYIYQLGFTASGQYYFRGENKESRFLPYAGLGLGANKNDYSVFYNIYKEKERSWGFLARPEAGVLVRISERRRLGLMAVVHYDYSTSKSNDYNYSSFSSVGFQVGIISMQW